MCYFSEVGLPNVSDSDVHSILDSGLFDVDYYSEVSGQANLSLRELVAHYIEIGWLRDLNPSRWFAGAHYLVANPDVMDAGINPLVHYLTSGQHESRGIISDITVLDRPNLGNGRTEKWFEEWNPNAPASGSEILVLLVGSDASLFESSLENFDLRAESRIDIRTMPATASHDFKSEIVQLIHEHSQIADQYQFIIIQHPTDPLTDQLINVLCSESRRFAAPIVGLPIRFVDETEIVLGFRQTSTGLCKPTLWHMNDKIYARSVPTQYVLARTAVVNVASFAHLRRSDTLTWRAACRELWLRQAPPRVVTNQDLGFTVTGPKGKLRNQVFVDGEAQSRDNQWFVSADDSNWPGFQRLRLVGEIGREIPGHPLAIAAIAVIEELGFFVSQTSEENRSDLAQETLADVKFSTLHDYSVTERGRRHIEFVLDGPCTCSELMCANPKFTQIPRRTIGTMKSADFWNLQRTIALSCEMQPNAGDGAATRVSRLMSEIGLRPSTTSSHSHG